MKDRALKVMALGFSLWGLFLRYQALANREWWVDETCTSSALFRHNFILQQEGLSLN